MAKKFGEMLAYSIMAVAFIVFMALSFAITWWTLSWALGWR